jgi:hypothetical protein
MALGCQQATVFLCVIGEYRKPTRDLRPRRASHDDFTATQEIRQSTFRSRNVLSDKPNQRGRGKGCRKSEPSIVAMKSGNADGAKGWRFEAVSEGNMCRH